jgi:DNA polymerase-4
MEKVGTSMSIGIAQNKLLADVASVVVGSGKCLEIEPGSEQEFLRQLPIRFLPGVGDKTVRRLMNLGVSTAGELAKIPERLLMRQFGEQGGKLRRLALGIDYSRVEALYPPLIIIDEHAFDDTGGVAEPDLIGPYLLKMCDRLSMKLRKRNQQAGVVEVRLEFEGYAVRRSYTFKSPACSARGIYAGVRRAAGLEMRGAKVMSARIELGDLSYGDGFQLNLSGETERKMKLHTVLDMIRSRFGENSIRMAVSG